MTPSDDGPLAKVSYLPGVRPPSEGVAPETRSARGDDRDGDGWYVEPSVPHVSPSHGEARRTPTFSATESRGTDTGSIDAGSTDDGSADVGIAALADGATRVPIRESPAMLKMRALVEAAAFTSEHQKSARPRHFGQKSYAEDTSVADDAPPSKEELAARAERVSMSALTRKGMSSWEMMERLRAQDLDDETVATEVARLEGVGLLDDLELAQTLVRTLQDRKGLGKSGIVAELRRRHVEAAAIEEALEALDSDEEGARALELAVKRAPQLRSLDTATAQRRLTAFLMRRGYSGAAISAAVAGALTPSRGPRFR